MPESGYVAIFLVGLLGGTHCIGMCGGIVSALATQTPGEARRQWLIHLSYNAGRVATYVTLGAVVGALGTVGMLFNGVLPVELGLYVLANLMLVALGLYLTGFTQFLAPIEKVGQRLWRHVQPYTRRFLPVRSAVQALPLGILWGFVPCGLVYSVLATALVSGSASRGAGLMAAFGLGTLPNLLLAGLVLRRVRRITGNAKLRLVAGLVVLAFGVFGLVMAPSLGGRLWSGVLCHV